jgi:hypothetical protein
VSSPKPVEFEELFQVFLLINRFSMLGEGYFYNIKEVDVEGDANFKWTNDDNSAMPSEIFGHNLLSIYTINSDFYGPHLNLANIRKYLTADVLLAWKSIDEALTYPCNAFFYMTQLGGLPTDMRLAYVSECFEPLGAFYSHKNQTTIEKHKHPDGKSRGALFNNLYHIIENCGDEIFSVENVAGNKIETAQMIVNNRVQLMHLKNDMNSKPVPDSIDLFTYSHKLHILFRHTLLYLVGVDFALYKTKLEDNVKRIDEHTAKIRKEEESNA